VIERIVDFFAFFKCPFAALAFTHINALCSNIDWKENSRAGRSHAQDSVASCLTILKDTPDKADISASVKTTLSQTQHSYASSPSALPGNPELKATDEIESPSDRPRGQNLLATELSFTCNSTTEQQKSGPTKLPSLQSNEDKSREPASEGLGLSSEFDIATPTLEGKSRSPISPPASTTSDLPESHKEPSSCEQALPPDAPHIQFSFAHSTLGIAFAREMNALCSETKKQYIRMDDLLWQLEHQGKERHEASLQMMQVAQELQHQRTMVLQKDLESKRSETLAAMAKANQEIAQFREQTAKANEERSQAREEMFKNRIELQRAQWRIKDLEQTIRVLENRCGVPYSSRTETTL